MVNTELFGSAYTSVLPIMTGLAYRSRGNSVTTANGSDVPLKAPATFVNPVALMESCSFMLVLSYEADSWSKIQISK